MMRVPTVDVAEVGNGAGSIAAIDAAGLLTVGPHSAGADPGPVCYGLGGTRPTVTDANVVLGFLPPTPGRRHARRSTSRRRARAIEASARASRSASRSRTRRYGIREVANANMVRAIRAVTVERGLDPRDFDAARLRRLGPGACLRPGARPSASPACSSRPRPASSPPWACWPARVEHHELRPLARPPRAPRSVRRSPRCRAGDAGRRRPPRWPRRAMPAETVAFAEADRPAARRARTRRSRSRSPPRSTPQALRAAFLAAYRETYGYAPTDAVEAVALRLRAEARTAAPLDFRALKPAQAAASATPSEPRRSISDAATAVRHAGHFARDALTGLPAGPADHRGPRHHHRHPARRAGRAQRRRQPRRHAGGRLVTASIRSPSPSSRPGSTPSSTTWPMP